MKNQSIIRFTVPSKEKLFTLLQKHSLLCYFFVSIIYMEVLLKLLSGCGLTDLLYPVLLAIPAALLLVLLCSLFPGRVNRILAVSATAILTFVFLLQYMYYSIFKTYLTFYSVTVGVSQAMGFTDTILTAIAGNILQILAFLLPLAFLILFGGKLLQFTKMEIKYRLQRTAAVLLCSLLSVGTLHLGDRTLYSPYDLYYHTNSINLAVQKLGLLTSTRLDISRLLFGFEDSGLDFTQAPEEKEPASSQDLTPESSAQEAAVPEISASPAPTPKPTATPEPYMPNVLDIDFDALIKEAPNETIQDLHTYFSEITPTDTNTYTGMFEGYNLIMVTAESFSPLAVDPDVTPTLYKLVNSGFVFEDFYTPLWGVSTSDGEYVALNSLIPKEGVWSFYRTGLQENDMRFTLGRQFEALGYGTYAYHNHTYDYYRRDVSHPNMGYTYKAVGNGLEVEDVWPESDLEMMQKSVDDWIDDEQFHAYYMTVSGHLGYSYAGNMMAERNRSLVENLDLSEEAQVYLSCNVELDKALAYLIDRLEEAGRLQDTVIVLSADHYPYGLAMETIYELAGHEVEETFELYQNHCIIWSASMEETVRIEKPTCSMDILPTVSNLFGLSFDSRLLMGTDALSPGDSMIIFHDSSFIKGDLRYDAGKEEAFSKSGEIYSEEYIQSLYQEVVNRVKISAAILDNDYYSYLP